MSLRKKNEIELYELMRETLHYLQTHKGRDVDLASVAHARGMSTLRFSHLFTEWVGISPKRFLSYLTKKRAEELLKGSSDVLSVSLRLGLSSPGRLHDLLVTHEAVSPGEWKHGDFEIRYGVHPSPFGWCVIGITARGVCALFFLEKKSDAVVFLKERWSCAKLIRDDTATEEYASVIFSSQKRRKKIPIVLSGTNFQIKVWEALLAIPSDHAVKYADIAQSIGSPKAVRAVGTACGENPIAYLIPCHRVLTSAGGLGGYRWGTERKELILEREALQ